MHSNLRWDIQRLLKLLCPTSSSTSCKAPLPSDKVALHIDPLGTLPCAFERGILASIPRERCPALASMQSADRWWFWPIAAYGFRTPDCTTPIATSEPTTKLPNPRSFSASCSVASRTAQPFSVTSTPTSTKRAYRAYPYPRMYSNCVSLLITYSHVHNDTISVYKQTQGAGLLNWWGFIGAKSQHENSLWWKTSEGASIDIDLYQSYVHICTVGMCTHIHI